MSVRILASRYVVRNAVAAILAFAAYLLVAFIHVKTGQTLRFARSPVVGGSVMALAFLGFVLATWPTVQGSRVARSTITALASLIAFSVWVVAAVALVYWFHIAVGGVE
jgi:hypothetical protein